LTVQSLFFVAAALLAVLGAAPATAQSAHPTSQAAATPARASDPHVRVENVWIPQPPPGAEVAAAYFTLHNTGDKPAVLVGVDCPLAADAMLHRTTIVAGESRMRMIDRLTIPPGQSVTLEPDGLHVMLDRLSSPLAVGQRVPLVLHFAGGQDLHVDAKVRPRGGQ